MNKVSSAFVTKRFVTKRAVRTRHSRGDRAGCHVHDLRKHWIRANVCLVRLTKNITKGFRVSTKL